MKLIKKIGLILLAALVVLPFAGCNRDNDVSEVAIEVSGDVMELTETTTLLDYMNALSEAGDLTFTISDGMVTSINGKENSMNSYWMIYTDDVENGDKNWTYTYNEKVYLSAKLGAGSLIVKDGCTYVWAYQSF